MKERYIERGVLDDTKASHSLWKPIINLITRGNMKQFVEVVKVIQKPKSSILLTHSDRYG